MKKKGDSIYVPIPSLACSILSRLLDSDNRIGWLRAGGWIFSIFNRFFSTRLSIGNKMSFSCEVDQEAFVTHL
jgi:hypothetical protein